MKEQEFIRLSRVWLRIVTFIVGLVFCQAIGAQTKLLRFPDLHGDQVVFTYAGDLWLAPSGGGVARQLTTHPGLELFAKFSPDGQWAIEGHGVEPDYDVDNDPAELIRGRDQQLEKAIELVLAAIEKEPKVLRPRPEPPIKTELVGNAGP